MGGRGYRWRASARVDCVDDDAAGERGGKRAASTSISGSRPARGACRRSPRKRLDLALVVAGARPGADALGIETTASFITGYPEETVEPDQADTLDLLGRCRAPGVVPPAIASAGPRARYAPVRLAGQHDPV